MQNILITGSNRGVGLALVKEYLKRGTNVIATCRNPDSANDLKQLQANHGNRLTIVAMDVSDESSIANAAKSVSEKVTSLDVLINNAGVHPAEAAARQFGQLRYDTIAQVVTTNAVAPAIVTQAFVNLLKKGKNPRVVMVSSRMGSIANAGGGSIAYRTSKSAMNMVAKVLSSELRSDGITVITTHPGHVATDMGGSGAPVKPAESAAGLANVIDQLALQQTGKFYNYTGEEIAW